MPRNERDERRQLIIATFGLLAPPPPRTESTAGPYESRHDGKRVDIIYATFTTPANAISGSAVCAFRLYDVEKVFNGAFKEQAASNYNWLPVATHKVPIPTY